MSPGRLQRSLLLCILTANAVQQLGSTAQQLPFQLINRAAPVVIARQGRPRRQAARGQRAVYASQKISVAATPVAVSRTPPRVVSTSTAKTQDAAPADCLSMVRSAVPTSAVLPAPVPRLTSAAISHALELAAPVACATTPGFNEVGAADRQYHGVWRSTARRRGARGRCRRYAPRPRQPCCARRSGSPDKLGHHPF